MSLSLAVKHRLGDFSLDVSFVAAGGLTAVFGASGSGKTTLINVVAGLLAPQDARIAVGDTVLVDTARGIATPAHRRRIGYVFQEPRLFPHLTVAQNLAYGRWFTPKAERYGEPGHILALLGIGHLLGRSPANLSGGEKQRVAIGRALLAAPRLMLMDEPLAALDEPRKAEILPYVERLRDELRIPILYVSHSMAEVARLATDIVVLAEGRAVAFGPAREVMQRLDLMPPSEREEGGAIIDMQVLSHDAAFDMSVLASPAGNIHVPGRVGPPGSPARIRIRARDVMLATAEPRSISALNIWPGAVSRIADAGTNAVTVTVDCGGTAVLARITRQSAAVLGLAEGVPVYAVVKAVSVIGPGNRSR